MNQEVKQRNYQIDVLKLICAVLILLCHTVPLVGSNSVYYDKLSSFGWTSVHIFFIISGFLMVKGVNGRNFEPNNAGKGSMDYVVNKFKRIALPYTVSVLIMLAAYVAINIYIYIYNGDAVSFDYPLNGVSTFDLIIRVLPELLGVNCAGFLILYNGVLWYISAMLIVMLPLCYLLIKNKDFFIYVLSPLAALLSFGFIYNGEDPANALVRAVSGLCFGVVAWAIYNKLCDIPDNKVYRTMVTLGELLSGGLFFYTWIFHTYSRDTLYCAALLLPIIIAIEFSNKSYISHLFEFKWMKCCGRLSLTIYLNHYIAANVAHALMIGKSYWLGLAVVIALTIVSSVINYIAIKIIKAVWNRIMSAAVGSK